MRKFTSTSLNLLLAAGVILILAGLLLISYFSVSFREQIPVSSIICMILGAAVFYIALVFIRWASFFFSGLYLFSVGLLFTFIRSHVVDSGIDQLWPLFVIFCGVCLFLTSLFKHKRVRGVYLFPSALIAGFGCIFLLFSFNILHISFINFISKWFPVVLICFGAVLVGIFVYQKNSGGKFPYDKDELSDNTDDMDVLTGDHF